MKKNIFTLLILFSLNVMADDCLEKEFQVFEDGKPLRSKLCADKITASTDGTQVHFSSPYFKIERTFLTKKYEIAETTQDGKNLSQHIFCKKALNMKDFIGGVWYHILPGQKMVDYDSTLNQFYLRKDKEKNEFFISEKTCEKI